MYEVELKVPAALGPVRERLEASGATAQGRVVQADTYYDHPGRDFASTDEALRLRRETGPGGEASAVLTYKGPVVDDVSKTREEVQTTVAEPDAMDAILHALDFYPAASVRKQRERYTLDGYTVALDTVEDVGTFVEVEAVGRGDELEALRAGAVETLEALGLDPGATTRTSYLAMVLEAD